MKRILLVVVLLALLVVALGACGGGDADATVTAVEQAAQAKIDAVQEEADVKIAAARKAARDAEAEAKKLTGQATGGETTTAVEAEMEEEVDVQAAFQKASCVACHIIPGVANAVGTIGPDLSEIGELAVEYIDSADYAGQAETAEAFIQESITDPDVFLSPACPAGPCQAGLMPATLADMLSPAELDGIATYLAGADETMVVEATNTEAETTDTETSTPLGEAPSLTDEEFSQAKQIFFDRCAGCHGVLRIGATGPALTPDRTLPMGTIALQSIIFNGTPRGMPDWGKQGVLSAEEAEMMARYVQNEPPAPPEMSFEQMNDSWEVFIAPEDRPTSPQHDRNWQDFFSVTLRDAGQVAIIDGETKEVVNIVDTGYAVHISRMSATGRYVYVVGRDGKTVMIDLWMETPDRVAEVKTCYDARSVDVSKYQGELGDFHDKYAIVGCYWPPHFVILDGDTLEPIKVVSTRSYTYDTQEYHPEPRVASIAASHFNPQWLVSIKETGQVWMVDYSDPINPTIKMIEAERFLHDGGWDSTGRYFLVAANARNSVAVIDAQEQELVAVVETGNTPHPGRGANWDDPDFGPVWTTSHLGEGKLAVIGTDPENNPENAWKVVREIELLGGGSLFLKTHPDSEWIWVDFTLNPDESLQRTICVIPKADPTGEHTCWEAADYGRAVHFEYNQGGDEVWVSIWGRADEPGKTGEIVIYDDKTLEEKARIPDLVTPTGKFNVYNTVEDIY